MADLSDQPPLMLCMESAEGEEVALRIEPGDDFQTFINKSRKLLGFEIDLNSITKNQPVSMTDNIYQFLVNAEHKLTNGADLRVADDFDQILESHDSNNDLEYILDDGTQIRASQIHFDNEDPLVDLSVEKIPFVKFNESPDDLDEPTEVGSTVTYNIMESPVPKWTNQTSSPSFINTVPFKLVCNNTSGFEAQFTKYLEGSSKSYVSMNNVAARNKSPRSILYDNFTSYEDNFQNQSNTDDFSQYTRDDILNMFKDSPVASLPFETNFQKRRHVRKSDPSRLYKSLDPRLISTVLIAGSDSQNCFICDNYVDSTIDKLYLFDNEDQRLHRLSPQKRNSQQLKIICEKCLAENFKPCRMKSPNQSLKLDEYLIIRNNQQYIFQKTSNLNLKAVKYSSHSRAMRDKENKHSKETDKTEYVKVEIGSDGEIVTKPFNHDVSDDVVIVDNEHKGSSSDVEIIEIDDSVIDNLEDADEEVKEFLGKYNCGDKDIKELKCRFCETVFEGIAQLIDHSETHKHVIDDGEVYPCPLCDYGYTNSKWLTGHLRAAHEKVSSKAVCEKRTDGENEKCHHTEDLTSSPIASRTRSSAKIHGGDTPEGKKSPEKPAEPTPENPESVNTNIVVKTEIKGEAMDTSDEEIWIVRTATEVAEQRLQDILHAAKSDKDVGLKKHKCSMCSKLFLTSGDLANHKCKRRFRKRKSISKDDSTIRIPSGEDFMKRALREARHKYDDDDDLLTVRPRRRRNKEPTSDPQVVTCHNCDESFTSKVRLKFHMQFHETTNMFTEDGKYTCTECDTATFQTETELFDHVHFQHKKKKRWQCPIKGCGKQFYLRASLTKHSRTHTDTRRYACTTCGKRFLDKQTLDEHRVTHLQIKPFQCHICLKQMTRRSRLRMHLRAHEEELCPRLVLVCAVCSRAFRDAQDVQDHLTKFPECIEEFANELKQETEAVTKQLSPTSGIVRDTVQVVESPKLSKPIRRQVSDATAAPLLSQISDAARSIIRVVEIEKAFRCEYCEDAFYSEDGLNMHRAIHKGIKNPFTCHICKVTFASYSRCTTHKTTHGFYKRSLADVKKQADKSASEFQKQADKSASEFPKQAGKSASEVRKQRGKSPGEPSVTGILGYGDFPVVKHFLCEDCGRSYLHWTYLQVHRRKKHAAESIMYPCNQCDSTFPNSWSLTYHRKKAHTKINDDENATTSKPAKDDYKIPCRDCDEILPNKTALYKHRNKEHSDNSLKENDKSDTSGPSTYCSLCGVQCVGPNSGSACVKCTRSFSSASLRQRIKLRDDKSHRQTDVDYACVVCKKSFSSCTELLTHTRSHSSATAAATATVTASERPHACPECGHRFRTVSMLNEHHRIHTGERPFPCDVCGIAFRRSTAMRNHRLIHTGVRAWACARCPKRFRIRSDLRTHMRLKHPAHLALIEISGLNPSPEEVMEHLTLNNIPYDKVIEITKISFPKGTRNVVPNSARALAMLSSVPRAQIACSSTNPDRSYELIQPVRRGRGIARNPRKLKTSQGENVSQQDRNYPITLTGPTNTTSNLPQTESNLYPTGMNLPEASQSGTNQQNTLNYSINVDVNQTHNNQGMDQSVPQASIAYPITMNVPDEGTPDNVSQPQTSQNQTSYPMTYNVANEELPDLTDQLLLRDGVLVNANQMGQLQLDDSMLLE